MTANEHAHSDRVPGLAWRGGFLYTASADGYVRMWDAGLDLVCPAAPPHPSPSCSASQFCMRGADDAAATVRIYHLGMLPPCSGRTADLALSKMFEETLQLLMSVFLGQKTCAPRTAAQVWLQAPLTGRHVVAGDVGA